MALLALLVAVAVLSRVAPLEHRIDVTTTTAMLGAATVAAGVLLGSLLLLRFRLTGDALALWVSASVLVFAVFGIGAGQLLPLFEASGIDTAVVAWVRPAGLVVSLALLLWALRVPEVDTRLRPPLLLLASAGAVMGLTFLLQLLPGLTRLIVGRDPALPTAEGFAVEPGIAVAFVVLAIVFLWRGLRSHRALAAWLGLMLHALAMGKLAGAGALLLGPTWQVGAGALRTVGLLFGLVGVVRELHLTFTAQSDRLLEVHVDAMAREARMEAQLAEQAERAHEARNALASIEGATLTLERHRDRLDPDMRARLTAAVTTEIARLQHLVSTERAAGTLDEFDLRAVVDTQLALVHSRGGRALADMPAHLPAVGRAADTAEALQNLLVNAQKYAPGSPIVVRGAWEGERVVIRVEDRGPGVATADRDRIFGRGERAGGGEGDGLGLYVAGQLLREQGGDLWLDEPRPSGGACFAFSLPAASVAGELDDEVGDVGEPGEVEGATVGADLDDAGAGAGLVGQPDDGSSVKARP